MPTVCSKHNTEYNKWGQCPGCRREAQKRYWSTDKGKIYQKRKRRKYRSDGGQLKIEARHSVYSAIRSGKLTRLPCQVCGNPKSEAHHYLGYSKEHWLHVVFLCRVHHPSSVPIEC